MGFIFCPNFDVGQIKNKSWLYKSEIFLQARNKPFGNIQIA